LSSNGLIRDLRFFSNFRKSSKRGCRAAVRDPMPPPRSSKSGRSIQYGRKWANVVINQQPFVKLKNGTGRKDRALGRAAASRSFQDEWRELRDPARARMNLPCLPHQIHRLIAQQRRAQFGKISAGPHGAREKLRVQYSAAREFRRQRSNDRLNFG